MFIKKYMARLMLKKSIQSFKKGDFDSAFKFINNVLKIFPKCENALYLKGKFYEILGKYNKSLSCYNDIIHIDSKYIFAWIEKALLFLALNKYDEALEVLDKGLSININNQKLIKVKIRIFKESGKYDDGLEYAKYILNDVNKELGIELKASIFLDIGRYDDAYNCFKYLYNLDQKNIEACYGLSSASHYLGNLEEAIDLMKKCIELDNNDMMFRLLYASYLIENESYNDALNILNESLKIYPDFNFYYLKGVCLEFLNNEKDAKEYYEKGLDLALALDTISQYNNENSSEMIYEFLKKLNSPDEAKIYFDKYKELNSVD